MLRMTLNHLRSSGVVCLLEYKNGNFLQGIPSSPSFHQKRNTAILKRRHPISVREIRYEVKTIKDDKYCIYDTIEETNCRKAKTLEVILLHPVEDLGLPGDIIEVKNLYARDNLLLPGIAVYASPENREKYAYLQSKYAQDLPSSRFANQTRRLLEAKVFCVTMNLDTAWQIEPWHIEIAFRREGVMVPRSAIMLPSQPITGPDLNLEGREFLVKVKINNKEEARVRFRVHHVTKVPGSSREPKLSDDFSRYRADPIFEDEAHILAELNDNDPEMTEREK